MSQSCNFREERSHSQAARSRNGVVGSTGTKTPTTAKAKDKPPAAIKNFSFTPFSLGYFPARLNDGNAGFR